MATQAGRNGRATKLLFILLVCAGLAYVALRPQLTRWSEEAARDEREASAQEAEAARLKSLGSSLAAAQAEAAQRPNDPIAQLKLATAYSESGKLPEALTCAEKAVALRPGDLEGLLLLADVRRRLRNYDGAISAYKAALSAAPNEPRAVAALAAIYVSLGWPRDAEALLLPAIRAHPDDANLKIPLAMAYMQHEDASGASRILEEVKAAHPNEPVRWSPLINTYAKAHRYEDAVKIANEALRLSPNNPAILDALGQAQYQSHHFQEALSTYQRVLNQDTNNANARYYSALCLRRLGQATKAQAELEEVLRRVPGFAEAQLALGNVYNQIGRKEEGQKLLAEYRQASAKAEKEKRAGYVVATKPKDPEAHYQMALVYQELGDLPRLKVELRKTLELSPQHPNARALFARIGPPATEITASSTQQVDAQIMAGLAAMKREEYAEAERLARQAMKTDPQSAAPYLLLARIYSNHGTAEQSMAALQEYLKRSKTPAPGYYMIGRFYYRRGDQAQAEQWLKRAIEQDGQNADYRAMLGAVYSELGGSRRAAEAAEALNKALALNPQHGEAHATLGKLLFRQQQWAGAVEHLRAAMKTASDPGPLCYTLGLALTRAGNKEEGQRMLAEFQAYQDYTRRSAALKRAIRASPKDRSPRLELIRLCIKYGQWSAADKALREAQQAIGEDSELARLRGELQAARNRDKSGIGAG